MCVLNTIVILETSKSHHIPTVAIKDDNKAKINFSFFIAADFETLQKFSLKFVVQNNRRN